MKSRISRTLILLPAVLPWQANAADSPRLESDQEVVEADKDDDRPVSALERARDLGLSADDKRPSKAQETTFLGKRLVLGGEVSTSLRGRRQFDLSPGANDDDLRIDPLAKIEAIWIRTESTVVFASARVFAEQDIAREGGNRRGRAGVSIDDFWLLKTSMFNTPLALQVGRQRLRDRREFWWDDQIDGVRLHYFGKKVDAYVGLGYPVGYYSTLGRMDPEGKGLSRAFGNLSWEWKKQQHVELYGLHQNDRTRRYSVGEIIERIRADPADARLTWVGARTRGCLKPKFPRRLCYWGDVAKIRGTEFQFDLDGLNSTQQIVDRVDRTRVSGWAYDAGINLELPLSFRPVVTLARARGTGDRPGTPGRNGAFRQTGLHKNESKYRGNARFRSYGEVLRPDLSNIRITTLALGLPLGKSLSAETLWHRYRQPVADNRIVSSPIGENPNGVSKRLGDEIDVVIGLRPKSNWEFEFTAGAFRAGPAFGAEAGRWASLVELKVDYNF